MQFNCFWQWNLFGGFQRGQSEIRYGSSDSFIDRSVSRERMLQSATGCYLTDSFQPPNNKNVCAIANKFQSTLESRKCFLIVCDEHKKQSPTHERATDARPASANFTRAN